MEDGLLDFPVSMAVDAADSSTSAAAAGVAAVGSTPKEPCFLALLSAGDVPLSTSSWVTADLFH